MGRRPLLYLIVVLALAAAYFASAKLGLRLAFEAEQVSPVWPPTGIALAAVLLLGSRVWPGIALGAFLANVMANEPIATACGIATGNTLEALTGAWLLRRVVQFDSALERIIDVLGLVLFAAAISTMVSATVGVISLCLGGVHPWSSFARLWSVWWLGDATGALTVAPAILVWMTPRPTRWTTRRLAEAACLGAAVFAIGLIVFGAQIPWVTTDHPLEYAIFPLVIWAALRFGQRGAAAVTLGTSALAIWGTAHALGPFSRGMVHESLVLLQAFLAVVTISALILGAALAERDLADRRRAVDRSVTHVLAEAASVDEAGPRILAAIGEGLDWDAGAFWIMDRETGALRCAYDWLREGGRTSHLLAASRARTFQPGEGLPGRVWLTGEPHGITDVTLDDNFPRRPYATRDGLRGGLAFPILLAGEVLGIVEFFSRLPRAADRQMLQALAVIGSQVGQFIDRRRAADRLRESEQNLRLIAENATDVVFARDSAGQLLYVNPAFEALTGYPAGALRHRDFSTFVDTADAERVSLRLRQAEGGSSSAAEEFRLVTRNGERKWCLGAWGPLADANGKQIGVQARIHDITERKAAEDAVREAGRRKDEFLAMLAHELRNPLAPIHSGLQLLQEPDVCGPNAAPVRDMVARQIAHLTRLVDDLLDVSRIMRGRIELRVEPLEIASVIARAVETARPMIDAGGHDLSVRVPPEPVRVKGDPVRLAQVFANLLNNAAKYTPPGGRIRVVVEHATGETTIRVQDNGIGIPKDFLPEVFEPFVQANRSLDRSLGGLGIGLSLVKRLVELHGGRVEAKSDGEGRGSEFTVSLPLETIEHQPATTKLLDPGANAPPLRLSRRMAVVDDNVDFAESLALLLRLRGHEVRVAHDGQAAMDLVDEFRPEFLLLDLGLPRMNGFEVAGRIRAQPQFSTMVLIAVSGYGTDEDRRRSREAGFDHHLVKPVEISDLSKLLST